MIYHDLASQLDVNIITRILVSLDVIVYKMLLELESIEIIDEKEFWYLISFNMNLFYYVFFCWRSYYFIQQYIRSFWKFYLNSKRKMYCSFIFTTQIGKWSFYILEPWNQPDYTLCNFVITVWSGFYKG